MDSTGSIKLVLMKTFNDPSEFLWTFCILHLGSVGNRCAAGEGARKNLDGVSHDTRLRLPHSQTRCLVSHV